MPLNDVIAGLTAQRNGPLRARADDNVDEDEVIEDEPQSSDDEPTAEDDDAGDAEGQDTDEPEAAETDVSYAAGVIAGKASATKRIKAILSAASAAGQSGQAAYLAFDTDMSATQAIGVLDAAKPAAGGGSLGSRMENEGIASVSPGASGGEAPSDYDKGRSVGAKVVSMKTRSRAGKEG